MMRHSIRLGHTFAPMVLCAGLLLQTQVQAHEFWLEPTHSTKDNTVLAVFFLGDGFGGAPVPISADTTARFELHSETSTIRALEVPGSSGSSGSAESGTLALPQPADGLSTIVYEPTAARHRYKTFREFEQFAQSEGLSWAIARHQARQLPQSYFSEIVRRNTKSLLCVNHAQGTSPVLGLAIELVPHFNPFGSSEQALSQTDWQVQLLSNRKPISGHQISLFFRDPQQRVTRRLLKTNQQGMASIPRLGAGDYLLNAVDLNAPSLRDSLRFGAVWESHWSSLYFTVGQPCQRTPVNAARTEPPQHNSAKISGHGS